MRPNQQKNRSRSRNGGRKSINPLSRNFESNGPDVKVRGNATHIADRYVQLARDAQSAGDSVMAENYLQHAEHYNRIISTAQAQQGLRPDQYTGQDELDDDDDFPPINDRFSIPDRTPPQQQHQQSNGDAGQGEQRSSENRQSDNRQSEQRQPEHRQSDQRPNEQRQSEPRHSEPRQDQRPEQRQESRPERTEQRPVEPRQAEQPRVEPKATEPVEAVATNEDGAPAAPAGETGERRFRERRPRRRSRSAADAASGTGEGADPAGSAQPDVGGLPAFITAGSSD
ncbi:MAG: hypothetical protein JWR75_2164 [Devosia sp.]|nr:hypothetical protein [Devosia sp.]